MSNLIKTYVTFCSCYTPLSPDIYSTSENNKTGYILEGD